jgi:hypothetical protein
MGELGQDGLASIVPFVIFEVQMSKLADVMLLILLAKLFQWCFW